MKHVLIDTCSLIQSLKVHSYSRIIQELEDLVNSNRIELITHEIIIEEWNKHKAKSKKQKEKKLKALGNSAYNSIDIEVMSYNSIVSDAHLDEQIDKLDQLLSYAKIKLQTPDIIKNETHSRLSKKLAPFKTKHKENFLNDWEIFGTVANHCTIHGIKQLFFISHNSTDFEHEDKLERKVDSSLIERFNEVDIIYFKNVDDFIQETNSDNYLPAYFLNYQIIKSSKYSFPATRNSNVLDALYYLYKDTYEEINFIPIHILSKCFPFSATETSHVYYRGFGLSYVNDKLVEFTDNLEIIENKYVRFKSDELVNFINDYQAKTEYVLRRLTTNLIFNISGDRSRKTTSTFLESQSTCDCFKCRFERFEFENAFRYISGSEDSLNARLKQAYVHCHIGNFLSASLIYREVASKALDAKHYMTYFIAKYNLSHLSSFLRNPFSNKEVNTTLANELGKIDPLEEAVKLKGLSDYNFLSFIAQEDFFNIAFQKITEVVNEILDHYYSQLTGGWSSNSHIWNLIAEFAKLDTLLNSNYILYDQYSNFTKLFEKVTEGIFASHAISENQESRFIAFDDYWANKFIFYGKKKSIITYFHRFKLKSLKYKSEHSQNVPFLTLANNILTPVEMNSYLDDNNDLFYSTHTKYFENLLTLSGLFDLDVESVNEISSKLLSFLKSDFRIERSAFDSISFFLDKKGSLIDRKLLLEFLNLFLHHGHDEDILETVINCFENDSLIDMSEEDFLLILNQSLGVCEKCNSAHDCEIVVSLYYKVSSERKSIISSKILEVLKVSFNSDLYLAAAINDIIPIDKAELYNLIDKLEVNKSSRTFRSIFSAAKDFQNPHLNRLLNACFKANIDTLDSRFDRFRVQHPYYEWLLDMEGFNYDKFDPEWVLLNQVHYYFNWMAKSERLKLALRDHLAIQFHAGIERVLVRITYYYP